MPYSNHNGDRAVNRSVIDARPQIGDNGVMADETIWPNNLRNVLKRAGVNQAALANALGWNKQRVNKYFWERRELTKPIAEQIAAILDVPWLELVEAAVDRSTDVPSGQRTQEPKTRAKFVHDPKKLALLALFEEMGDREREMWLQVGGALAAKVILDKE